mmetsp:Transcript_109253/g.315713  ORF Transcript_109253/g.315713 Transcript_109253/m.315713 type:complete len:384 (+) Transcript_109253:609-1760(+)
MKHSPQTSMPSAALWNRGPCNGVAPQQAHFEPTCEAIGGQSAPKQPGNNRGIRSRSSSLAPLTNAATSGLPLCATSIFSKAARPSPSLPVSWPDTNASRGGFTVLASLKLSSCTKTRWSVGSKSSRCVAPTRLSFSCFRCARCAMMGRNWRVKLPTMFALILPAIRSPPMQARSFHGPMPRQPPIGPPLGASSPVAPGADSWGAWRPLAGGAAAAGLELDARADAGDGAFGAPEGAALCVGGATGVSAAASRASPRLDAYSRMGPPPDCVKQSTNVAFANVQRSPSSSSYLIDISHCSSSSKPLLIASSKLLQVSSVPALIRKRRRSPSKSTLRTRSSEEDIFRFTPVVSRHRLTARMRERAEMGKRRNGLSSDDPGSSQGRT